MADQQTYYSTFKRCRFGLYTIGGSSGIFANTFEMGPMSWLPTPIFPAPDPALNINPDQFGVYATGKMPTLNIHNNDFSQKPSGGYPLAKATVGSYARKLGDFNHYLLRNKYQSINYANIADDNNASTSPLGESKGLHYICNDNSGDQIFDFAVTQDGSIRREQGVFISQLEGYGAAGNTFSYSGAPNDDSDFNNLGPQVRYYYFNGANQEPLDVSGVDKILVNSPSDCGRRAGKPGDEITETDLTQLKGDYQTDKQLYEQAKAARLQATDSTAFATQKSLEMSGYREEMDFAIGQVLAHATAHDLPADTLLRWLSLYERPAAEYIIAQEYLAANRPQSADSVLLLVPQKFVLSIPELAEQTALRGTVALLSGKDIYNLDSVTVSALQPVAKGNYGHASQWAKNIRIFYGFWYAPEYELPESGTPRSQPQTQQQTSEHAVFICKVVPNPARDRAVLLLSPSAQEMQLRVFDATGKVALTEQIAPNRESAVLVLSNLSEGLYFFWVSGADGEHFAGGKFMVRK